MATFWRSLTGATLSLSLIQGQLWTPSFPAGRCRGQWKRVEKRQPCTCSNNFPKLKAYIFV